ncbi:CHAP domain-containing protein [Corynebacterium sp. CCM 8863]|uniref:CHAP domain-containing protein n=2 Tax=Corynebacterium meridianum TaxID=2765363 RepID=A0A934M4L7_9CORY|nr:CHAP domain-containing protein [Corynebacterium meridianum]
MLAMIFGGGGSSGKVANSSPDGPSPEPTSSSTPKPAPDATTKPKPKPEPKPTPKPQPKRTSKIVANARLTAGQQLTSENGEYFAAVQDDGNFVIRRTKDRAPIWATGTEKVAGRDAYLRIQKDGNLVLYSGGQARWASDTAGTTARILELGNDGVLRVNGENGHVFWMRPKRKDSSSTKADKVMDRLISQTRGKQVYNHGGNQCVALFNHYNENILGHGFISVILARQLYSAAPDSHWEKLPASAKPRRGDVAIWGKGWPWDTEAGHVAMVVSDDGSHVKVWTQNPGAAHEARFTKSYLIGYLRPKL